MECWGESILSLSKSFAKQLRPSCHQRSISAITLVNVNVGRYNRSDSRTLVTIYVCRQGTGERSCWSAAPVLQGFRRRTQRSFSFVVGCPCLLGCAVRLLHRRGRHESEQLPHQHQPHDFVDQQTIIVVQAWQRPPVRKPLRLAQIDNVVFDYSHFPRPPRVVQSPVVRCTLGTPRSKFPAAVHRRSNGIPGWPDLAALI